MKNKWFVIIVASIVLCSYFIDPFLLGLIGVKALPSNYYLATSCIEAFVFFIGYMIGKREAMKNG